MASEESRSGVRARSHIRRVAVIVLVLCLAVALGAGAASAKKKKSKPSVFTASAAPNLVVPDAVNNVNETIVTSAITVPKKFKGRTVGDLNITGVQSTGDTANAAGRLNLMLVGPGGRSVLFDAGALGGQSIGPVTFDDDTQTSICDSVTCSDPDASLHRPFVGTTNLAFTFSGDTGPLSAFNGTPMRGAWTLYAWDNQPGGNNVVNTWGLQITAAKPVTK
jgi:hypothetical protein